MKKIIIGFLVGLLLIGLQEVNALIENARISIKNNMGEEIYSEIGTPGDRLSLTAQELETMLSEKLDKSGLSRNFTGFDSELVFGAAKSTKVIKPTFDKYLVAVKYSCYDGNGPMEFDEEINFFNHLETSLVSPSLSKKINKIVLINANTKVKGRTVEKSFLNLIGLEDYASNNHRLYGAKYKMLYGETSSTSGDYYLKNDIFLELTTAGNRLFMTYDFVDSSSLAVIKSVSKLESKPFKVYSLNEIFPHEEMMTHLPTDYIFNRYHFDTLDKNGNGYLIYNEQTNTYKINSFDGDRNKESLGVKLKIYVDSQAVTAYNVTFVEVGNENAEPITLTRAVNSTFTSEEIAELLNKEGFELIIDEENMTKLSTPITTDLIINFSYREIVEPSYLVSFYYLDVKVYEKSLKTSTVINSDLELVSSIEEYQNKKEFIRWDKDLSLTVNELLENDQVVVKAVIDEDILLEDEVYNVSYYHKTNRLFLEEVKHGLSPKGFKTPYYEGLLFKEYQVDGVKVNLDSLVIKSDLRVDLIYQETDLVDLIIQLEHNPYNILKDQVIKYNRDQLIEFSLVDNLITKSYPGYAEIIYLNGLKENEIVAKNNLEIANFSLIDYHANFYAYKVGKYFSLGELKHFQIINQSDVVKPKNVDGLTFVGFNKPFEKIITNIDYLAVYQDKDGNILATDKDDPNKLKPADKDEFPHLDLGYKPIPDNRAFPILKEVDISGNQNKVEIKLFFKGNVDFNKYQIVEVSYGTKKYQNFEIIQDEESLLDKKANWVLIKLACSYDKLHDLDYFKINDN